MSVIVLEDGKKYRFKCVYTGRQLTGVWNERLNAFMYDGGSSGINAVTELELA